MRNLRLKLILISKAVSGMCNTHVWEIPQRSEKHGKVSVGNSMYLLTRWLLGGEHWHISNRTQAPWMVIASSQTANIKCPWFVSTGPCELCFSLLARGIQVCSLLLGHFLLYSPNSCPYQFFFQEWFISEWFSHLPVTLVFSHCTDVTTFLSEDHFWKRI